MSKTLTLSATYVRDHFSELLNKVYYQGVEIVITKHGKPMAMLVPPDRKDKKQA